MSLWAEPGEGSGSTPASPGTRLGDRYVLGRPIASGGMAQVWTATDTVLNREVAAKILHPHLATDDGFVERFRREAVAAARLKHPSIVAVFDTISLNGVEAIMMELIKGQTLRALLDELGAMPAVDVIQLGSQIAAALDVAHQAGIVHRDIKPANIMVNAEGRFLVTDFGIAKAGTDPDLTATGTLLGTAKYLAPEQVTGESTDPRSDLYSLGVVMFEALTGSAPFRSNTDAATALARLHQDAPSVRSLRPNVSAELDAVVTKMMARNPDDRYARASDLQEALARVGVNYRPADDSPQESAWSEAAHATIVSEPAPGAQAPAVTGEPSSPGSASPVIPAPVPAPAANHPRPPDPPSSFNLPPIRPGDPPPFSRHNSHPQPLNPPAPRPAPPATTSHRPPGPPVSSPRARPPTPPVSSPSVSHRPASRGAPPPANDFQVLGVDPARGDGHQSLGDGRIVRSGRSRVIPVLSILIIVAGLLVALVLLTDVENQMGIGGDEPSTDGQTPIAVASVQSFDPQTPDEVKEEREDLVPLAVDGDPSTAWTSETYRQRDLGAKDGVGYLITLTESRDLTAIDLDTGSEGWTLDVYVGDVFGDDPSAWGPPAATVEQGSGTHTIELDGVEGSSVLLWIRDTGQAGDRNRFELAEVAIR